MEQTNSNLEDIKLNTSQSITITWKKDLRLNSKVRENEIIGTYKQNDSDIQNEIKSTTFGRVRFLADAAVEKEIEVLAKIERCNHHFYSGVCSKCGMKKGEAESGQNFGRFAFANSKFEISQTTAKELFEKVKLEALKNNKLFLILDLDNTIIHAHRPTKKLDFSPPEDFKTPDCFNLNMGDGIYFLKLRPNLKEFLDQMSQKYVIYIYTMGTRLYAELILSIIDKEQKILSKQRIFTRDEMGKDNIKRSGNALLTDNHALILDDLPHVWDGDLKLVRTKPFFWFYEDGDKLVARRKVDIYLKAMMKVLSLVHQIFFEFHNKGVEVPLYKIYHSYLASMFKGDTVSFKDMFNSERQLQKSNDYKTLKKYGAEPELECWGHTSYVFSRADSHQKEDRVEKIPNVSLYYITFCEMFSTKFRPEDFNVDKMDSVLRRKELMIKKLKGKGLDYHKQPEYLSIEDEIEKMLGDNFEQLDPIYEQVKAYTIQKIELDMKNKRSPERLEDEPEVEKHRDTRNKDGSKKKNQDEDESDFESDKEDLIEDNPDEGDKKEREEGGVADDGDDKDDEGEKKKNQEEEEDFQPLNFDEFDNPQKDSDDEDY